MPKFTRELNTTATLITSGESGTIIGRAEYLSEEPAYLIRYKCADGRQTEQWWTDRALKAV